MTEHGVVVKVELGIDGNDLPIGMRCACRGDHQRIDFSERCILGQVERRQFHHGISGLCHLLAAETQIECGLARLECSQSRERVQCHLDDGIGASLSDVLNLHAALGAGDQGIGVSRAVHDDCQVVLLGNIHAGSHQDALHFKAFRRSLRTHHAVRQHELGGHFCFLGGLADLHEPSLAAPTCMDLCLDHHDAHPGSKQRASLGRSVRYGLNHAPGWDGNSKVCEELSCLVFVDLHVIRSFNAGEVPGGKVYGISGLLQPRGACCAPSTTPKRWAAHSR